MTHAPRRPLTAPSESERATAFERFAQLRPTTEGSLPLAALARELGRSPRTLQRWRAAYRRDGLAGLVRPRRSDRGRRRLAPALQEVIEGLALQRPRRTVAAIRRQVAALATQCGWPAPTYKQVYVLIRGLDPALVLLAHEGSKAYRETFDLLYRREASQPNTIWQADHTPLDIWILDERDHPARPWLTVVIDDYSRAVAGYAISLHAPSALQTALALRQAMWRKMDARWQVCGIPEVFYTDHGSDFTSHHLEQVAADVRMVLVFSIAGQPRGRGRIERFFLTVNQLFLCHQPGYTPVGSTKAIPTLTLPELDAQFHAFLVDDYHQRVHSETGMAPQARWEAGGFLPRLPESLEQLDLLLLTVAKSRRVHQDGIRFQGFRYLDLALAGYVGEDVVIRYDPRDMAEIRVYHRDAFVCRAVSQDLAGQTIGLKDIVRVRNERRRQLQKQLGDRHAAIDALLAIHQPDDPPEPSETSSAAPPRLKRYFNE